MRRTGCRAGVLGALLISLVALASCAPATFHVSTAPAPSPWHSPEPLQTVEIDFVPSRPDGATRSGVCWTNSLAVSSVGAWRCLVADEVFDPCFELPDGSGVVCGANPARQRAGFLVQLQSPLPSPNVVSDAKTRTWLIELADGTVCRATAEAAQTVRSQQAHYDCGDADARAGGANESPTGRVIVSEVRPGTPWIAERFVLSAVGADIQTQQVRELPVRRAWHYQAPGDTANALASDPTKIVNYLPQKPAAQPVRGGCWTNSRIVANRAAWRCEAGEQQLDPCFALEGGAQVVCQPNPLADDPGILVELDRALPPPDLVTEKRQDAWLIELDDHTICQLAAGATGIVNGKRITYRCNASEADETVVILGELRPGVVWTAEKAVLRFADAATLASPTTNVPVRTVVRGPAPFVPIACASVGDRLAAILGREVTPEEAPFIDPLTQQRGTGCEATVTSPDVTTDRSPVQILQKTLRAHGWHEDQQYRAAQATIVTAGFRKNGGLCLVRAVQKPTTDRSLYAAGFEPMGVAGPTPSQYAVTLSCARDPSTPTISLFETPAPWRIEFEAGATAGSYERTINTGELQEFMLRALEGQVMIVDVASPGDGVSLGVYGANDGVPLVQASQNAHHWEGKLPATQDYLIRTVGRADETPFRLQVVIPAVLDASSSSGPVVATGSVGPGRRMYYTFTGQAGERARIDVRAPNREVGVTVTGLDDDQTYHRSQASETQWTGSLPRSQDYLIEIVSGSEPTTYTVEVTIELPLSASLDSLGYE